MSRNTALSNDGRYGVAWGKDHACGWFIQVFDLEVKDQDSPEALVVDQDNIFDGLELEGLIDIANKYGVGAQVQRELYGFSSIDDIEMSWPRAWNNE